MAENIRVSKLMKFGIQVARNQAIQKNFYSPSFKESDFLNLIVSEWLRQNFTDKELSDMGFYEII